MKREMEKSPKEKPLMFKDAVGRKFDFRFRLVKTWAVSALLLRIYVLPTNLNDAL